MEVGAWVWENFDIISGISFLPYTGHNYQQAPYQPVDVLPEASTIDWSALSSYETEDTTKGSQTMACTGDACEVVDI